MVSNRARLSREHTKLKQAATIARTLSPMHLCTGRARPLLVGVCHVDAGGAFTTAGRCASSAKGPTAISSHESRHRRPSARRGARPAHGIRSSVGGNSRQTVNRTETYRHRSKASSHLSAGHLRPKLALVDAPHRSFRSPPGPFHGRRRRRYERPRRAPRSARRTSHRM